jgi:hypothetical protein
VLIEDAVTRGEYAFAAATDGTMYSNAATGPGAFGLIIDSQDISTGATYASVQLLGARGGGGGTTVISTDYTYIVKQTTESVASSTVLQDDDELQFVGVSGAQYEWDMTLIIDHPGGNNSTDFKFEIGEDGTFRGFWHLIVAATGDIVQGSVQTGLTAHVINSATSPFIWRFIGGYGAAAGGTFRLRWCQNVGNANDLRVVAGSTLRYRRIA